MESPDGARDVLEVVRRRLVATYPDLLSRARGDEAGREGLRRAIRHVLVSEGLARDRASREELAERILEEIAGYGPLGPLLTDPAVTEVMVNGPDRVYVERAGRLERVDVAFRDASHILDLVDRLLAGTGRRVDLSQPYVDARLADGSRLNAVIPPVAVDGPALTLRRFGPRALTADDLVRLGTLPAALERTLRRAVRGRLNVVVSGGAATGKTTLLGVLAGYIRLDRERVVTIEDAAELRLADGNVVRLECRPPNIEGRGQVDLRQLVRNALRMRPDRIIVGECRGAEAFDMLQAMNTGHPGSMTTVHANGPADALRRLEIMVLMAGEGLPHAAVREHIGWAVDLLVHLVRRPDGSRQVADVCVVQGYDRREDRYRLVPAGEVRDGATLLPLSPAQRERVATYASEEEEEERR